ncbi:MAG: TonB-dependent receptor [Nitrospirae bacterium]|nr:TonB-dependent receptor [Nitrospirota bacterium]
MATKTLFFDFGTVPWNDQQANFNHLYPSYEIYGKLRYRDFTIKALASEKSIYSFWTTQQATDYPDKIDQKSIITSIDVHLELSHHGQLSGNMTLDTKITVKQIDYLREKLVDSGTQHGSQYNDPAKIPVHATEEYPEKGVGLEFILNWDINKKHKLLAGAQIRVADAGPGEITYVDVNTGNTPVGRVPLIKYNKTRDKSYGAYVEDTYYVTDKLTLIGGLRIDYNDPREKVGILMPRGAVIYKFSDALSLKYMYNTGYFRPSMDKSFEVALTKAGSVRESEKIGSHDVALIYNDEKTQLIIDAFHMKIKDRNTYDALAAAFVDAGDIWSRGLEVSFKRSLLDGKLIFHFNYGYATAETKDKFGKTSNYYGGIPNHIYAAGLTYLFTDKISLKMPTLMAGPI